jgi:coenzyme F420 hydrogenase subunit delta
MDILPVFCKSRVLILGVGNVMFSDDGFGPEVAENLIRSYSIPGDIYVMDVGTGARKLLFTLTLSETRPEEIVIVDAVDWGQDIGQVIEISIDDLPVTKIDDFSLHQVPTSNMLRELQDHCGIRVNIVACDVGNLPQMIQPGLTPAIQKAVIAASETIADRYSFQKKS